MIVKITDYSLENAKPQDKVSLNTGKNCVVRNLAISGISRQKITVKLSNDGVIWAKMTNEDGSDFFIEADDSFPFYSNDTYLQLESDVDATGIIATIGLKRGA